VPATDAHNLRAVLVGRGFRRLLATRLVSQIADGWFQSSLAASVLFNPEKQASAFEIATGFAVLLLPYSMIGPFVGVFLDRWSRRSIIFVANTLRAGLVVPVVFLLWWGQENVPFLVLAFVIIGMNRFFLAGLSAATPHVVSDHRLVTANALSTTLGSVCYSLGLASSVLLIKVGVPTSFHGYALVAGLAPAGYLVSALIARASFEPAALGPDARERRADRVVAAVAEVCRGMVAGVRHLAGRRGAAYGLVAQSVHRGLYGVLALSTLLLYRRYFNSGDNVSHTINGLGQVLLAGGLGLLLAAFLTPPVSRRIGGWRWLAGLFGMVGAVVLVFGLPFISILLVVAVFFINLASQGTKIVVDTALQHECADEYRGRVFSVNDTAYNVFFVVGLFIAALTLPENGKSATALVVVSAGYVALTVWYSVVAGRWVRQAGDDIAQPVPEPAASPAA
jgi:MFS family permease